MANVLNEEKKQQVLALGRLGWSLRRIQQATGIRRETAGVYLKAAGIAVRPPSGWGRCEPKPANEDEVITDSGARSMASWSMCLRDPWFLDYDLTGGTSARQGHPHSRRLQDRCGYVARPSGGWQARRICRPS